jgi:hypothetical protein
MGPTLNDHTTCMLSRGCRKNLKVDSNLTWFFHFKSHWYFNFFLRTSWGWYLCSSWVMFTVPMLNYWRVVMLLFGFMAQTLVKNNGQWAWTQFRLGSKMGRTFLMFTTIELWDKFTHCATLSQAKMLDSVWEITKAQRAGVMDQVVECLLNKYEAQSSRPRTTEGEGRREGE